MAFQSGLVHGAAGSSAPSALFSMVIRLVGASSSPSQVMSAKQLPSLIASAMAMRQVGWPPATPVTLTRIASPLCASNAVPSWVTVALVPSPVMAVGRSRVDETLSRMFTHSGSAPGMPLPSVFRETSV